MKVQYTDNKTFELKDSSEKILGHITYDSLWSYKANAVIGNDQYEIVPTGFFQENISVTKNGRDVARMVMDWKAQITISFKNGQDYLLKATGTFVDKYVLEDKDQHKILSLIPEFNWKKFNYNYSISNDNKPSDILLVLLATYSTNYCMAAAS